MHELAGWCKFAEHVCASICTNGKGRLGTASFDFAPTRAAGATQLGVGLTSQEKLPLLVIWAPWYSAKASRSTRRVSDSERSNAGMHEQTRRQLATARVLRARPNTRQGLEPLSELTRAFARASFPANAGGSARGQDTRQFPAHFERDVPVS